MFCPKCRSHALQEGAVKGSSVVIDYCSACKGFWLDAGELEKISALAVKELTVGRDAERSDQSCPRCDRPLYAFDYPQTLVTVDMCKRCKGIWIDAGELKEIETVRRNLQKYSQAIEYDEVKGVKGWLIRFIENAIDSLESA